MDEMKLNLGSKIMRRLAAKFISRYLRKQLGVKVNIDLNTLKVSYIDGDAVIKSDLELRIDRHEFSKILSKIDMEEI